MMNAYTLMDLYHDLRPMEQRQFDELYADLVRHRKSAKSRAGALMGSMKSEAKAEAARRNGAKGGRPRKAVAA